MEVSFLQLGIRWAIRGKYARASIEVSGLQLGHLVEEAWRSREVCEYVRSSPRMPYFGQNSDRTAYSCRKLNLQLFAGEIFLLVFFNCMIFSSKSLRPLSTMAGSLV